MHKLAIFVEGYTELLFMDRLITEIGGENIVATEHRQIRGGGKNSKIPRSVSIIKTAKHDPEKRFYILLFDCGGDRQVATRIRDEHEFLTRDGYTKIIGMRDVFPDYAHADIPRLEMGLRKYIKTSLIPVEFILSVMEIEAWFLAEFNHFLHIDPVITVSAINHALGFDPEHDDMSLRLTPKVDLEAVYNIGGKSYAKGQSTTISVLDFPYLYLELSSKILYLQRLGNSIDDFFNKAN